MRTSSAPRRVARAATAAYSSACSSSRRSAAGCSPDLGQEHVAGPGSRGSAGRGGHGACSRGTKTGAEPEPLATVQLGHEPVAVAAVDRADELDDLPFSERVVRSNWNAGECSGTPSISDSSSFVTVGSIVWMPPTISIP